MNKALTIAGSDSGGGAGIQADLKTFQELGVYGMSAITSITAQNTLGVQHVFPLPVETVASQIDSVACDLLPEACKTGMLFDQAIIRTVAQKVKEYKLQKVVVDPVMVAKGGAPLLKQSAVETLIHELLPVAYMVTPNLPEAEVLTGIQIRNADTRRKAMQVLASYGPRYVLLKGGHDESDDRSVDLLYDGEQFMEFSGKRIHTKHTHGTGCTFSAAITAELAKGHSVAKAVETAKHFIQAAIEQPLGIGGGHGPTNHWAHRSSCV